MQVHSAVWVALLLVGGYLVIGLAAAVWVARYSDPSVYAWLMLQQKGGKSKNTGVQRIPRVIHRTWKTTELSGPQQQAWDYTAKHNPGWEQRLWTDSQAEDFMRSFQGGKAYATYSSLVPGAARADLFRYCVMFELGGVYLDIKSGAGDLRGLIGSMDEMIVSSWRDTRGWPFVYPFVRFGELQQWWLAAKPGHPRMMDLVDTVIANVDRRFREKRTAKEMVGNALYSSFNFDVLCVTGPIMMTHTLMQNSDGVRVTPANGNGVMVYDVGGQHQGGVAYNKPGDMIRKPVIN